MEKRIVLKIHKVPKVRDDCVGVVRISPEAEDIVRQLERETGLSARNIVSQIIIQGSEMVSVEEVR